VRRVAVVACAALLAACTPRAPEQQPLADAPPDFPAAYYRQALAEGKPVFQVDTAQSLVTIVVRRDGRLARLGHDHVVAARDVAGFVAPAEGRADFYLRLDRLTVDEPALRAEAGLDTQPSAADIEGTRRNMLETVLEADKHPFVLLRVKSIAAQRLSAALTLHGVTRDVEIPARIEPGATEIAASGSFELKQTDFGIVPMSVLGGAIQVRDRMELRFAIRARRAD
jgi:hypothetical protein